MNDVKTIDSKVIFGDEKVVYITYADKTYTLRITKENKLILTK